MLEKARPSPYVGHADLAYLDAEERNHPFQTIYIGVDYSFSTTIPDTKVVSFAAPVARLFYDPTLEKIVVAGREISVAVTTKRTIIIRDGEIIRLTEDLRRSVDAIQADVPSIGTDSLTDVLSGTSSSDGHLEIIVATIEPDQYRRIANISDQVLVVQGAAGSGKSEIGLHRIAYLLSPFSDIGDHQRPTPDSVLFIGPSRSFLEYISDVLPQLGVNQRVPQATFAEWVNGISSTRLSIQPRFWNNLLDKGEPTLFDSEVEAFKGSMAMADALDRYVDELTRNTRAALAAMPAVHVRLHANTIPITKEDIRNIGRQALATDSSIQPLNQRRGRFIQLLAELVTRRSRMTRQPTMEEGRQLARSILNQLENQGFSEAWPLRDFRESYTQLISESELLVRLAKGQIAPDQVERLREEAPRALERGFEDSDRAPLRYLEHLLNGTITPRFNHIVVDEAQDLSPLDFKLLRLASTNGWFTVLGDTAQRLMPHRGIRRWRDLDRVLGRAATTVQHARLSYRATKQITRFNNRILRLFDQTIDSPIPFDREGPRVEYGEHRRNSDMYRTVVDDLERIRNLNGLQDARIGILARDQRNLNAFYDYCQQNGVDEVALFGEENLDSPTVLARMSVTQGLEYDAVIVLGVNDSFRSTAFNRKLLYLACTRARHYLALHWSGTRSPILEEIGNRGIKR